MELGGKYLGGLLGTAAGDAIGELAFRWPERERLEARIASEATLRYTDDTAMMLALAESLAADGAVDPQRLGEGFRRHFESEPWRGYGPGPPRIFAVVAETGVRYEQAARELYGGEGSLGNGAAMRVAPLGLCLHHVRDLYEHARRSALVTHAHPVGIDGAAVLAKAIGRLTAIAPGRLDAAELIAELIIYARTAPMAEALREVERCLRERTPPPEACARLGRGIAVHESLPFALYSVLTHPEDFRECLYCAVLHGGDRDTMGAMACAASGAYLGAEAIPREWREKIEKREWIESLARALHQRCMQLR